MNLYNKIAAKDRTNQTIREIAEEVGDTKMRVRYCMGKHRLAWKLSIAHLVRSKDRSSQTIREIMIETGGKYTAVHSALVKNKMCYRYEGQPSKYAKVIRSKDRSKQTVLEISYEVGCSTQLVRAVLDGRGLPYLRARYQVQWYDVAEEVVLRTAESIDTVCARFGLKPEKLIKRLYES